jgi:hypothetical protein
MQSTVQNGKLQRSSPSALQAFRRCNLRWYHDKVLQTEKTPRNRKGADTGSANHKLLEDLLLKGVDNRGDIAKAGDAMLREYERYWPVNGGSGQVEREFSVETNGGTPFTGRIDFYIPSIATIIDHKFKKEKKWWDKPDDLRDDEQAIIYGKFALEDTGADTIDFIHHNHTTSPPYKAEPTKIKLTRDDILLKYGALSEIVDIDMARTVSLDKDQVPYNVEACWDFGGCDFARTCHRNPKNAWMSLLVPTKGDAQMGSKSILESISNFNDEPVAIVSAETIAIEATPPPPAPIEEPKPEKKARKTKEPAPVSPAHSLFIDCVPSVAHTDITGAVLQHAEALAKEAGVPDIRLATGEAMGFGKWKAVLAARLKTLELPANAVLHSGSDFVSVAIEALSPLCGLVVRG